MLIHPWDAVADWRPLLATRDFGQLVTVSQADGWPVVVPTHFVLDDDPETSHVLLHVARPNPVWKALEQDDRVVLAIATDYLYVDAETNADPGTDPTLGVPTSYYTAIQVFGRATVIDDPADKASAASGSASTTSAPSRSTAATRSPGTGPRSAAACPNAAARFRPTPPDGAGLAP